VTVAWGAEHTDTPGQRTHEKNRIRRLDATSATNKKTQRKQKNSPPPPPPPPTPPKQHISVGLTARTCDAACHLRPHGDAVALDTLLTRLPDLRLDTAATNPHIHVEIYESPTQASNAFAVELTARYARQLGRETHAAG